MYTVMLLQDGSSERSISCRWLDYSFTIDFGPGLIPFSMAVLTCIRKNQSALLRTDTGEYEALFSTSLGGLLRLYPRLPFLGLA